MGVGGGMGVGMGVGVDEGAGDDEGVGGGMGVGEGILDRDRRGGFGSPGGSSTSSSPGVVPSARHRRITVTTDVFRWVPRSISLIHPARAPIFSARSVCDRSNARRN